MAKKPKASKEANWKKPRNDLLKLCLLMIIVVGFLKMELQNPPPKVNVGTLVTNVIQGVKDVGNGLIEMGRSPMYIESRPIRPFEYPVGPSNRVRRCTYCD